MLSNSRTQRLTLLALPFLLFGFALIFLTLAFPIKVPITDDWLYLPQGTHLSEVTVWSYFELITGHQQILVKILILFVSFLPGNYVQNLTVINILIVSLGLYLLAISQLKEVKFKISKLKIFVALAALFNFKALYIYMSATGLGLSLAILLIGIYFFGMNTEPSNKARAIVLISLFLSPFTTGLGLIIPMSHLLSVILKATKVKEFKRYWLELVILGLGIILSYLVPTIFNNLNERSGVNSVSDYNSYVSLVTHPLKSVIFMFGLIGNPLTPSSRFDPLPQLIIGVVITAILVGIIFHSSPNKLYSTLTENKNPFLSGLMFFAIIISFRGSSSVMESAAPRYAIGSSLFLFGAFVFCLNLQESKSSQSIKILTLSLALMMTLSASGAKTGMEWLTTRHSQSEALFTCMTDYESKLVVCLELGGAIREEGSSDADLLNDMQLFKDYIEKN